MKITKSELKKIIKEEAMRFKKKVQLEKELSQIQSQLDEVHAGGEMSGSENDGVHAGQRKPEFTKKGTHLVEDEMEDDMDEMNYESEMEEGMDEADVDADIDLAEIFAEMEREEGVEEMTDESDCMEKMDGESDESMEEMTDESMDEMSHENEMEEMTNESKKSEGKVLNEEQIRMRELAGIKKVI